MPARMVARASGSPAPKPTGCLVSGQTGLVLDGAGCVQQGEEPKLLKKIAATLAIVAVLAGLGAFGAVSIFTSTAEVPSNAFTTGTVVISTLPTSALVTYTNMVPGDVVTAPLTVTNGGSLALRYAVTSTTTEDTLAAQLDLEIKSGVTNCDDTHFVSEGTTIYGPGDLGSMAGINVVGDPTTGHQAGDRYLSGSSDIVDLDGTYPPGAGADAPTHEDLCFQVTLPSGTGDTFQGLTTTATFTFNAEQRRNNPP
jgi:spore coat-associated protein N